MGDNFCTVLVLRFARARSFCHPKYDCRGFVRFYGVLLERQGRGVGGLQTIPVPLTPVSLLNGYGTWEVVSEPGQSTMPLWYLSVVTRSLSRFCSCRAGGPAMHILHATHVVPGVQHLHAGRVGSLTACYASVPGTSDWIHKEHLTAIQCVNGANKEYLRFI